MTADQGVDPPLAPRTGICESRILQGRGTFLHALGVDLKVQEELLRHADIRTTMNIYTPAVLSATPSRARNAPTEWRRGWDSNPR